MPVKPPMECDGRSKTNQKADKSTFCTFHEISAIASENTEHRPERPYTGKNKTEEIERR